MERVQSFFLKNKCRLPLSPSLFAKELNVKVLSVCVSQFLFEYNMYLLYVQYYNSVRITRGWDDLNGFNFYLGMSLALGDVDAINVDWPSTA